jgi:hypothetical protein
MTISDRVRVSSGSLLLLHGAPLLALPFLDLPMARGPRWLLDGGWLGTVIVIPMVALFAAALLVGPFVHLARPQLERLPSGLRLLAGALFLALPWSAVCYWLVPSAAGTHFAEWALVVGAPALIVSALIEREDGVWLSSAVFALATGIPLFVLSDVRAPFVTLWTFGGVGVDAFLVLRAAAAAAAVGFATTAVEAADPRKTVGILAGALALSALASAVATAATGGKLLFDGAALAMPLFVWASGRSVRLAQWAPKLAMAQVLASALFAAMALWTSRDGAAIAAGAHGALAVVVGLALAQRLAWRASLVRVRAKSGFAPSSRLPR